MTTTPLNADHLVCPGRLGLARSTAIEQTTALWGLLVRNRRNSAHRSSAPHIPETHFPRKATGMEEPGGLGISRKPNSRIPLSGHAASCTGQPQIQFPISEEVPKVPVPPKPAHLRRNRNRKQGGEWVVLDEVYSGPIPHLPRIYEWSEDTRRWWKAIWRTPMATQWLEGDVGHLSIVALVRQRFLEGDMRLAREVRQSMDDFGLTPKGRQMRRWVISEKDAERAGISLGDVTDLRKRRAKRLAK
jgi:hypothetical protein